TSKTNGMVVEKRRDEL
ncbi:MAG: hypothetical protein EZS28_055949, partial [Streblomastix strix]